MLKKKEAYLNFPNIEKQYDAIDSCFTSKVQIAILISPSEIHLWKLREDKKQILRLSDKMQILRLFTSSEENQLIIATSDSVLKYDLKEGKVLGQFEVEKDANIHQVVIGSENIAFCGKNVLIVTNSDLQVICTVHEKFSIRSGFWQRDNLLFYTTKIHWKYVLMNGQTGLLKTLDEPLHLVKKLSDKKFFAFN